MIDHHEERFLVFLVISDDSNSFVGINVCRINSRRDVVENIEVLPEIVTAVRRLRDREVVVINLTVEVSEKAVEAANVRRVLSLEISKMPLANQVCIVASVLEVIRHQLLIQSQAPRC